MHTFGAPVLVCDRLDVEPDSIHGVRLGKASLTVRSGEIVAIAGIAGNGQSELYAAISGEGGRLTGGSITIAGQDVTREDINARRKAGAAFVPEARLGQATLPQGMLSDNVVLSWHATEDLGGRSFAGLFIDRDRLNSVSTDIVIRFNVRTPSDDPVAAQLSGGNLQKYIVGREVARNPKLMVIDQPSWGVDARAATHIRQTLIDLAATGTAILIITQDLDEALSLADFIVVMREGELSAARPVREVTRDEIGMMMTHSASGHSAGISAGEASA